MQKKKGIIFNNRTKIYFNYYKYYLNIIVKKYNIL